MEETVVIRGLTRQAKMFGLPQPYFLAVAGLWMIPFMLSKSLLWLVVSPGLLWVAARSITAINPNAHRPFVAKLQHMPQAFGRRPVRLGRSTKGRVSDV